jgi:tRNA 2-selenouridine synthase
LNELPFQRDRAESWAETPLTLAQLREFDDIVDARSPAEFADDHLPGAINAPTLDDRERALVGTVYKQQSAFEAKRIGAPLAARNVALHIETLFAGKPRGWKPLVYCWRGGSRSGAMTHILRQVGWDATRLRGGYKAFRTQVLQDLEALPGRLRFHVVCGATGTGKSRLLEALERSKAQVLDLELLAAHRGSVLGDLPGEPQPPQKLFESRIWERLSGFDPARPVYVESESKKVGNLRVPEALIAFMRASRCFRLEADTPTRVKLLVEDYAHFVRDPGALAAKLDHLAPLHGTDRIGLWKEHMEAGRWDPLVEDLLRDHYDPAYHRSLFRNYRDAHGARVLEVKSGSAAEFDRLALSLSRDHG